MDKENILWNFQEAQEELSNIIDEIKNDPEFEFGDFVVGMTHLYHHINTAWNAQNESH